LKRGIGTLFLLLALASGTWAEDIVSFRGYFKAFSILVKPPVAGQNESTSNASDLGALSGRLRLKLALHVSDGISFNAEYDISPRVQDTRMFSNGLFVSGWKLPGYRLADIRNRLYPGPGRTPRTFGLYENLDRFALTIKTAAADIILGRQALAWGSARVVNPTDVLSPFAFNELDKEERTGVDALRVRIPLGALGELDLGAVAGERLKAGNNAFFIRGKIHVLKTDVSPLALAFRNHLLLGLDLARSIGRAGAWLEAAYVIPDALLKNGPAGERSYVRASAGVDYNISPKLYGFLEYHFNSAGASLPGEYPSLIGKTPYRDGAVYLLGRHYLSVGTNGQISPLIALTGLLIANLDDSSLVFSPSFKYNVTENIDLGAGVYLGFGKSLEFEPGLVDPFPYLFRSEFGAYPDMAYASLRIYF
jgi:hypothetical protein